MENTTEIHFFGGHADGTERTVVGTITEYDFPTDPGNRHPRKKPFTRYQHSELWSGYFGRSTFVPEGFPGKPPREKVG